MDADVFTGIIILRIDILCRLFKIDGHEYDKDSTIKSRFSRRFCIIIETEK